jgi:hypothetical protein
MCPSSGDINRLMMDDDDIFGKMSQSVSLFSIRMERDLYSFSVSSFYVKLVVLVERVILCSLCLGLY